MIKEKTKELKDSIKESILKFEKDTGIIPVIGIEIKRDRQFSGERIIDVIVSVNVEL